jgi:hypothetical protein
MASGIVHGLSLSGRITLKEDRMEQSDFQDYPVLRLVPFDLSSQA